MTPMFYLLELSLTDSVSVEDDARRLESRRLVEVDQEFPHHGRQLLDDFLSVLLDSDRGGVAARVGVHAAYHLNRQRNIVIKSYL